jgi:hypothetical protein
MQGGYACVDQALALPAVGIARARDVRRLGGFFLEGAHDSA